MNNNNERRKFRIDFPGHCQEYKEFPKYSSSIDNNQNRESFSRVLIVADQDSEFQGLEFLNNLFDVYFDVEVKFSLLLTSPARSGRRRHICDKYANYIESSDVNFLCDHQVAVLKGPTSEVLEESFKFNSWLAASPQFDFVLSLGKISILYIPLINRKLARAHIETKFVSYAMKSSYYDDVISATPVTRISRLNQYFIERSVMEFADRFFSGSQHFLNWSSEFEIDQSMVNFSYIPYPFSAEVESRFEPPKVNRLNRVAVILEPNALFELQLCLDALDTFDEQICSIDFLFQGSCPRSIRRKLLEFRDRSVVKVRLFTFVLKNVDYGDLVSSFDLVILPKIENLNPRLVTYLKHLSSVKILSNDVCANGKFVSFLHNPGVIKRAISESLSNGEQAKAKISLEGIRREWLDVLMVPARTLVAKQPVGSMTVTVCITHRNRPKLLLRAIASIQKQTFTCNELIIVDDGSNDNYALEVLESLEKAEFNFCIRVIRQENRYVGAARNRALEAARSDYIFFMDDDNEAMAKELEELLSVAKTTEADFVTCFSTVFSGESPEKSTIDRQTALFVGPNSNATLFANPVGDANMLARVNSARNLGGFSEYYRVGREDQEFFHRALKEGYKIEIVPEPLYYYRLDKKRIRQGHTIPFSGFSRVQQSQQLRVPVEEIQQSMLAQGLSYAVGPLGTKSKRNLWKITLYENVRFAIARYPILYKVGIAVRSIFLR